MKKLILTIFAVAALTACDNPVTKKIKETKQQVSNTKEAFEEITNMQEDIEALKDITPLTNEEFKAWLPDQINGMKRTAYKAGQGSYMNIAMVEATYTSEDKSKKFKIEIIDGAGPVGSAATAGMRILFSQDFEEETETMTRRTITKDGVKAIEEYKKNSNRSDIQLMQNDRFYIKANGTNMDIDETWEAIDELDADDLG